MNGLTALVTGGASGLGRATVNRLAKKGVNVVFCDLPTSDGAAVAEQIKSNTTYIPGDVTNTQDISKIVDFIRDKYGKLDVVVNCAGQGNAHPTFNFTKWCPRRMSDFNKVFRNNVLGTLNVIHSTVDLIAQNEPDTNKWRGVIVNTAGVEGIRGTSSQSCIAAASGAILAMTKPMAHDFLIHGIRVVTILPGLMDTPLAGVIPPLIKADISNERIIGPNRFGHPNEYAHLVEACICNPSINGVTLELAGGLDLN